MNISLSTEEIILVSPLESSFKGAFIAHVDQWIVETCHLSCFLTIKEWSLVPVVFGGGVIFSVNRFPHGKQSNAPTLGVVKRKKLGRNNTTQP